MRATSLELYPGASGEDAGRVFLAFNILRHFRSGCENRCQFGLYMRHAQCQWGATNRIAEGKSPCDAAVRARTFRLGERARNLRPQRGVRAVLRWVRSEEH